MMDKLGKKIIDNLKLKIVNIHLRFEESTPVQAYAWGAVLGSMSFQTTDKNWKP